MTKHFHLLSIAIFFIAAFLYTYKLGTIPLAVHGDEGETASQAVKILHGNVQPLIGVGWYDLPILSFMPHALTMKIFGETIFGDRVGAVLFGLATLPFVFLLVSLWFSKKTALLATYLLSTSHMWIALSRLGIAYTQSAFLAVGCFYFLFKGLQSNQKYNFVVAGIFLGMSPYFYYSARVIPLIVIPLLLILILKIKNIKREIKNILLFFATSLLLFLPQGIFYLHHPETLSSRSNTVFIFSDSGKAWSEYEYKGKTDREILFNQAVKSISIFNGDNSTQYGYKGQLLDFGSLFLFFLGLYNVIKQKSNLSVFLITWLGITLFIGQVLTTIPSPIFLPRFVVGLPVLFIFIASGIEYLEKRMPQKLLIQIFIVLFLLYTTWFNVQIYFQKYPLQQQFGITSGPHGLTPLTIASFINTLPTSYQIVFLSKPYIDGNHGTIRFLTKNRNYIAPDHPEQFIPNRDNESYPTAYIVYPEYEKKLSQIKTTHPFGKLTPVLRSNSTIDYYIYTSRPL